MTDMTRKTKKLVYNTVIVCLLLAGLAYVCARFVHPVVEAIADATGAAVSLIPQDNATGNFVKVEQRVPVRIRLTGENGADDLRRLRAGLNVECSVGRD